MLNSDFLAFFLDLRKYAYIGSNLLLTTVTWGFTIMEFPDEILKEIRENGYDPEFVKNYLLDKRFMRELEDDKEYDAA